MPNILFASNSVSHFPGTYIGATGWMFDSNRVPYAVRCPIATIASSPLLEVSQTDETWFHFRHGAGRWDSNEDAPLIEVVDPDGNRLVQISYWERSAEGYHMRVSIDGQSFTNSRDLPMLDEALRTYDLQVKTTGVQAEIRLYVNEIMVLEQVFAITAAPTIGYFWIGGNDTNQTSSTNYEQVYSELLVADGDTRNARLDLLRPTAAGAYDNWNGPLSSLSDDDPTTGMTTTLANQSQSSVLTPYTGANNISNIVQVTTAVRGINSPENLQHLIRMSGTDYLTANFAIPNTKAFQVTDWRINPATSQPWEATDLVNTEFGFKSIA